MQIDLTVCSWLHISAKLWNNIAAPFIVRRVLSLHPGTPVHRLGI
uniref:Uncharacterized protein n=1 Tax=Arundo donax TaxID=35708 RepID=A0A0A8YQX7_ARUDO